MLVPIIKIMACEVFKVSCNDTRCQYYLLKYCKLVFMFILIFIYDKTQHEQDFFVIFSFFFVATITVTYSKTNAKTVWS